MFGLRDYLKIYSIKCYLLTIISWIGQKDINIDLNQIFIVFSQKDTNIDLNEFFIVFSSI
jgi:hypothetical protein